MELHVHPHLHSLEPCRPHCPRRKQAQEVKTAYLGSHSWPAAVFLTTLPLGAFQFSSRIPSSPHARSVLVLEFSSEASLPQIMQKLLAQTALYQ